MPTATIFIDHSQRRASEPLRSLVVSSSDWGGGTNVWQEPVGGTVMLRPLPISDAWQTTFTGNYARYTKSDYSGLGSSWHDVAGDLGTSDHYVKLIGANSGGETAVTTATHGANQPFYIKLFNNALASSRFILFECGWADSPGTGDEVSLRVWTDGFVEVWRDQNQVGEGRVGGSSQQQFVDLLMIPYRQRDLLVWSQMSGQGFIHSFAEVDTVAGDPITPATKFWWKLANGDAMVQCAKVFFEPTGNIESRDLDLVENTTQTFTTVKAFADGTTVTPSLLTGTGSKRHFKLDLSGGGTASPWVYGAAAWTDPVMVDTDGGEVYDVSGAWRTLSLDVPDGAEGATVSMTLKSPASLPVANIRAITNRPVELRFNGIQIIDGRSEPVEWDEALTDEVRRFSYDFRDQWKLLEHHLFKDPLPLDGLKFEDAVELVLRAAGFEGGFSIQATSFTLPSEPQTNEEWNVLAKAGDSAADVLRRLFSDYAGNWIYSFTPTASGIEFWAGDPSQYGSVPLLTVYQEQGTKPNATDYVYRSYRETRIEPEATEVFVTGYDPRRKVPVRASKFDLAAADPVTPASSRPENWTGERRAYGLMTPDVRDEVMAQEVADILYDRLTPGTYACEFESDLLLRPDGAPVWKGQPIHLQGRGNWRVLGLSAVWVVEHDAKDVVFRRANYIAEYIGANASD